MSVKSPFAVTTFCDDIRYELQNKISLVGIYGGDMISAIPAPFVLPRFGVFLQFRMPVERIPSIDVSMFMPDATEPFFAQQIFQGEEEFKPSEEFEAEIKKIPDAMPARLFNIPFLFNSLTIPATGILRIRLMYGSERVRADSLRIIYRPPESQQQPPAT
jgi:hypothetical protein